MAYQWYTKDDAKSRDRFLAICLGVFKNSLKDKKVNNKRANILFIAYEVKDFYLLLENKVDFRNIIIATKNHDILNSLENTFSIKYVDLNLKQGVVRNIQKLLRKTFKPVC